MRGSFLRRVFTVTVAGAIWMVGLGAVPAGAHPEAHCEKEASTTSSLGAQLLEELVAGSHNDCTAEGIDVSESCLLYTSDAADE